MPWATVKWPLRRIGCRVLQHKCPEGTGELGGPRWSKNVSGYTMKFNMEPENGPLEKEILFGNYNF